MEIYFQHISFRLKKMPKVNKKINAVVELDTDTDDESIIKVTAKKEDKLPYVSPVLNSKQFSLYKSSNTSFCDKNGAPFCPDCPSGLELSTMVDKNGLFVCADKHRVAISARGAFVIRRDKYVDNGYIFPVCDKCNRSLMNVTANVASAYFGKVFFTCSCLYKNAPSIHRRAGSPGRIAFLLAGNLIPKILSIFRSVFSKCSEKI